MSRELDPVSVAARLAALRSLYVAETAEEALARISPPPRARPEVPSPEVAARRLGELRALVELTRYLHRRGR